MKTHLLLLRQPSACTCLGRQVLQTHKNDVAHALAFPHSSSKQLCCKAEELSGQLGMASAIKVIVQCMYM